MQTYKLRLFRPPYEGSYLMDKGLQLFFAINNK
jgi:hypothetical protein